MKKKAAYIIEEPEESLQDRDARLSAAGWVKTTVQEFLGLSNAEMALIETQRALTRAVRERRMELGWTQTDLAQRLGSSQSRVAFLERGSPKISTDLMLRALFAMDVSPAVVGALIAKVSESTGVQPAK